MVSMASINYDMSEEQKCQFLQNPVNYPSKPARIDSIETHMSYVFLDDTFAYKLKKSIHNEYVDFHTLELRHHFCEEEVRLNQRLAPDVYLGLVPLTINNGGGVEFAGKGKVVDWLVKMRRLPANHMLDKLIQNKQATTNDIYRISAYLVEFYSKLTPAAISCSIWRYRLLQEVKKNETALLQYPHLLPKHTVQRLCAEQRDALNNWLPWFAQRLRAGRIVEGHGDLRPEHICLQPEPVIIDCLEFSRDLRVADCADEICFLALELERLQAPDLADALIENYLTLANDRPPSSLLHFYQGVRACVRARIAIRHLDEKKFRRNKLWQMRALQYIQLAEKHHHAIKSTMEPLL